MIDGAIPVWFDGIHFRSTTEARYAHLLKSLGMEYIWEPEGFSTDNEWYRPDFLITVATGLIWAEVKGAGESLYSPDCMRFRRFAVARPRPWKSRAVLFTGQPDIRGNILVIGGDGTDNPVSGQWEDDTHEWISCPSGHHFDIGWPGKFRGLLAEDGCPPFPGNGAEDRLASAVLAARSARFGIHEDNGPAAA
jgi:hypothetical protein